MLEWLKTVLGDAYTPEIDTAVSQEIGKGFVARTDFNTKTAKVTELETEVKQLREGIKTRDTQLSELKKSAGDNAELQKQIDTLTQQNKDQKATYDKELATVKLTAAVDAELTAAGSKNNIAVRAMLADFLKDAKVVDGKVTSKENGETITLGAKVEAMKRTLLLTLCLEMRPSIAAGNPARTGTGQAWQHQKLSEMSYSELTEYMAKNPDAKLE